MNFKNLSLKELLQIFLGLAIILLLIFLYFRAQLFDLNTYFEITNNVKKIQALHAQLNEHVLKSRLNFSHHYDDIADIEKNIEKLTKDLHDYIALLPANDLKTDLNDYQNVLKQKFELIESFKGEYAIYRNSLYFIPNSTDELHELLINEEVDFLRAVGLDDQIQALLQDILEYNLLLDHEIEKKIIQRIAVLKTKLTEYPQNIQDHIQIIINHTETILKQEVIINAVLNDMFSSPASEKLQNFYENYILLHTNQLKNQEKSKNILVILVIILSLWIVYIGYRLDRSYHALDVVNKALRKNNETLEQRVYERTQALAKAYDDLKNSQVQLVQSEKMISLGQMMAGLVHEINTPLGYAKSNVSLVLEQIIEIINQFDKNIVDKDKIYQLVQQIQTEDILIDSQALLNAGLSGLDQISNLVKNLKNFSRLDRKKIDKYDINEGLDSVLIITKQYLKNRIIVHRDFAELPKIIGAPSQINQVFLNIIVNAAQAIKDQGEIFLTTALEKDCIKTTIQDNGPGIPEDILSNIFDPFFTTKEVGEGTGLGLSIAYQIIEEHGGSILVSSEIGKGTTFTILLPTQSNKKCELRTS